MNTIYTFVIELYQTSYFHVSNTLLLGPLIIGGAISNMYSIMAARYKYFPEVKTKGMAAVPKLVLFTSEHVSSIISINMIAITGYCDFCHQPCSGEIKSILYHFPLEFKSIHSKLTLSIDRCFRVTIQ